MGGLDMNIFDDCKGQGAAEYILLFGGVIVIAIAALIIYNNYLQSTNPLRVDKDASTVRNTMNKT